MRTRPAPFLALVAAVALTGCITGERPTLVDDPATVIENPSVLSVLDRLGRAEDTTFTATYSIIPTATGETTQATVEVANGVRRVTIGDIEYTSNDDRSQTCEVNNASCVAFIDEARISNLNITSEFFGPAFAARLRLDASRRVGFPDSSVVEIADMLATCIAIPLPGTGVENPEVRYCALDAGPLARYFGADVTIDLRSYVNDANIDF